RNDGTMLRRESPFGADRIPAWAWTALCVALAAGMAYLRLGVYPDEVVPLTDALVLMICLLSRDVRVLWLLASAFAVMVSVKAGKIVDERGLPLHTPVVYAAMQMANIVLAATVIHIALRLTDRLGATVIALQRSNAELEASNEELAAREEEITQQNEELQSQAEELEQQTEELNTQTEELQAPNEQLAGRERTLGELLQSNAEGASEEETLAKLG